MPFSFANKTKMSLGNQAVNIKESVCILCQMLFVFKAGDTKRT